MSLVTLWAPAGPSGKQTVSPGPSSSVPSGWRTLGAALEHHQPFLVAVLEVVRADALAGGNSYTLPPSRSAPILEPNRSMPAR